MMGFDINSQSNERIKRLARLQDRRHRDREGVFIVEGPRLLSRAIEAGFTPVEVYTDGVHEVEGVEATSVEPSALDKASYRSRADGVIAVFGQFKWELESLEVDSDSLLLVVEGVEKPGNLGAIVRTADAVGATAVVTVGGTVDLFNPNVLRSSTGAVFSIPIVDTELAHLVSWAEIPIVAASPEAATKLWDANLHTPVALMVGAEDTGLSEEARHAATALVSIPMSGTADSLNTSVTMALLAYEAVRQREKGH